MSLDPRTPVLVGAGAVTRHDDDPTRLAEAIELMDEACRLAAADAGAPVLLAEADVIAVPDGIWSYPDPARLLAERFGADARTVLGEIGVLQQTLLSTAAATIARGDAGVVVVVGGEAKHRALRAGIAGLDAPETAQPEGTTPDQALIPAGDILTSVEIERDLAVPAHQYAMIDNALAHADGLDHRGHLDRLGRLWSRFASVAATRPEAWDRSSPTAEQIVEPTPANRLVASPYTKRLCSQWNVDQAAALVLCSVETAEARGVPRDRWVFPMAGVESNLMVPLPGRAELHRSPAMASCARAGLDARGIHLDEVGHLDLYSCFPAAVQVQARELGLALDDQRGLTVTGGMTFGGGPLNNYVLQATVALAERLRGEPGSLGLSTSISGMITKFGLGLWSSEPGSEPFAAIDVTEDARATTDTRPIDGDLVGPVEVVGHTVVHLRGDPFRAVAIVQDAAGVRSVAGCDDAAVVAALTTADWHGRPVELAAPGRFVAAT